MVEKAEIYAISCEFDEICGMHAPYKELYKHRFSCSEIKWSMREYANEKL